MLNNEFDNNNNKEDVTNDTSGQSIRQIAVTAAIALSAAVSQAGHAAIVNVSGSGTVGTVDQSLQSEFTSGQDFSFSFSYDDQAPDTNGIDGIGAYDSGVTDLTLTIGGTEITSNDGSIGIIDEFDPQNDVAFAGFDSLSSDNGSIDPQSFGVALFDSSKDNITGDQLGLGLFDLSNFDSMDINLIMHNDSEVSFNLNQLQSEIQNPTVVPLNDTALYLGTALLALGAGVVGRNRKMESDASEPEGNDYLPA